MRKYKKFAKVEKGLFNKTVYFMVDKDNPNQYCVKQKGRLSWKFYIEDYNKDPSTSVERMLKTLKATAGKIQDNALMKALGVDK